MTRDGERKGPAAAARERIAEGREGFFDELQEQLDRTRLLLTESPEAAAEVVMSRLGGEAEVEARVAADMAAPGPLAHPENFLAAHRLAIRALEILDREGYRNPPVSKRFGPLKPLAEAGAEFVAKYIVKSYAESAANSIRRLYTRREPQAPRGTGDRLMLAQARVEMERVALGFAGGGLGAPALIAGGAAVPVLASASQLFLGLNFFSRPVLLGLLGVLFVLFGLLSSVLLSGAAVAHRRSRMIAQQPLMALWEAVGHARNPPQDDSQVFASVALFLSAIVWVVIPLGAVAAYFVT